MEEVLYSAMEDFFLSWVMGKGLGARNINLKVPPFTFIGATTRYAMVSAPLRNRFGAVYRLDFYEESAIQTLLHRSAEILHVEVTEDGVGEIARRARGTPRVANRLLRRVRDYAQVVAEGVVTGQVAQEALSKLDIDPAGLDEVDHKVLRTIVEKFDGGPRRSGDHRRVHQRGVGHHHGRIRAIPVAARAAGSHPSGTYRHPSRL